MRSENWIQNKIQEHRDKIGELRTELSNEQSKIEALKEVVEGS